VVVALLVYVTAANRGEYSERRAYVGGQVGDHLTHLSGPLVVPVRALKLLQPRQQALLKDVQLMEMKLDHHLQVRCTRDSCSAIWIAGNVGFAVAQALNTALYLPKRIVSQRVV
jgi:hypothetical protein